jgi:hypothetical protein
MLDALLGSTAISLALASAATGGIAVAIYVGNLVTARAEQAERDHIAARERLPEAARLEHVDHLLRERESELRDVDERLGRVRQEVAEAERAKIDAEQWRDLAEQAKRDYEALADERREVDGVRAQHEKALVDLSVARQDLEATRMERGRVAEQLQELSEQIRSLEDEKAELAALEVTLSEKRAVLDGLRGELARARDQRDELLRADFNLNEIQRVITGLEERRERVSQNLAELDDRRKELETEVRPLEQLRQNRDRIAREADELGRKLEELTTRRLGLEATVGRLVDREEELRGSIASLRQQATQIEQEIEALKEDKRVVTQVNGNSDSAETVNKEQVLSDLVRRPSCLFDADRGRLLMRRQADLDENAALTRVSDHLHSLGLSFDQRIIKRFHTCLKTGRISPLAVLAGISGTGKSQLPQRYAEAMGLHFLKIAVQPRWDSPQDLFGFYNYLERKYKATELARALVYMDPLENQLIQQSDSMRDRVLLVLLDEMNIARVEYYFSEFLSRLEGRPSPEAIDEDLVRASRIEIEVGLDGIDRPSVYPGHNVLFVGTMNEDESTQALSDKVLDRANVIRFLRPDKLEPELHDRDGSFAEKYLPFTTWQSWHRSVEDISPQCRTIADRFIDQLNVQLDRLRRPFGHRVNQAILSYVANHPDASTPRGCKDALADMLEMRVLPKLRGMEVDDRLTLAFQRMEQLIRDELEDSMLADAVKKAFSETDMFDWTGRR